MKKWIAIFLALCLSLPLLACGKEEAPPPSTTETTATQATVPEEPVKPIVGISLPNDTNAFWLQSGQLMKAQLEEAGYTAAVLFAENDIEKQERHLREMLLNEVVCIVVAAIDSFELADELADAKAQGIPVIAYERLLMNTDAVDGYISFDYETIGKEMAQQVILAKQLDDPTVEKRPYTIELFMDTPASHSSYLLHQGAIQVLQPYLDSGALVCCSGRLAFEDTCIPMDTYESALNTSLSRLRQEYSERRLDICFAATDIIADACRGGLSATGHTVNEHLIVTGQGGGLTGSKAVANSRQLLTVYKDVEALAKACTDMALRLIAGEVPETNASYNNGLRPIPAMILPHKVITRDNYTQELVETDIYSEADLPAPTTLPTEETTETTEAGETTAATEADATTETTAPSTT